MSHQQRTSVQWSSVLKISGAFTAFLIGSGFATGQEAMQFFVAFGLNGLLGGVISFFIFVYVTYTLLRAGERYKLHRNEDVFRHYCGTIIGVFLTWYTMIFIVAVHAIMLAGAGATLQQAYGLHPLMGSGLMALLSMITLLLGLSRIIAIIGMIGPVIILMTILIAVLTLFEHGTEIAENAAKAPSLNLLKSSPNWLLSCFLYVGLTLPGLASFLPAVGATATGEREVKRAAIVGPLLFVGAMILVSAALLSNIDAVVNAQIPIMSLATAVLPIYGAVFAVIIFLGIYTTTTPLIWTVCSRFAQEQTPPYRALVIGLSLVGFLGGTVLPFDRLVNLIYPTVGYAGLLFLACAVVTDFRAALRKREDH